MSMLLNGLLTGVAFGYLLQKARAVRYDRQLGALRLMDMTIVKFMLTSIVVGMVGVYFLKDLGLVELAYKPTIVGVNAAGGLVFGLGWGLIGYCPGTAAGAFAEGRWDALWGLLGMLAGAAAFAETYPAIARSGLVRGNLGSVTLPSLLGVNHWVVIAAVVAGCVLLFAWFEKKGL